MGDYQIRIIGTNGQSIAYSCHCVSAFAAVRRAKSIASPGDAVEVWVGMECVFNDHAQIVSAIPKPRRDQAT